jgi:S-DNA-T family DNA segregation ATPase FtsK/SpoIIIE
MPVVTEAKRASRALRWAVSEMEKRYKLMATCAVRNIEGYNDKVAAGLAPTAPGSDAPPERLAYCCIIIDELADLMLTVPAEIEEPIARLAQMARAVGIHLVLATQRPSVDVITGVIKANFPSRARRHAVHARRQARALSRARRVRLRGGDRARGEVLDRPGGAPARHRPRGGAGDFRHG